MTVLFGGVGWSGGPHHAWPAEPSIAQRGYSPRGVMVRAGGFVQGGFSVVCVVDGGHVLDQCTCAGFLGFPLLAWPSMHAGGAKYRVDRG